MKHTQYEWSWNTGKSDVPNIAELLKFASKYRHTGCLKKAEQIYHQVLAFTPDDAETYNNLGGLLHEQGHFEEAVIYYEKAVTIRPNFAIAYTNLGDAFVKLGQAEKAIANCKKAISINPNFADAYNHLGNAYKKLGQFEKAIIYYKKAISIKPSFTIAYTNLGNVFENIGSFRNAISNYKKAIAINPNYIEAYINLGAILENLGYLKKAIICYKKAIDIKPNFVETYNILGMAELSKHNFKSGWEGCRYRHHHDNINREKFMPYIPKTVKPLYNGESLENKKLYIWSEQGFGDMIMFSRFLNVFASKSKSIIFYTFNPLERLFRSNFRKIEVVSEPYTSEYDYHMPLMDAGYILRLDNTNIPQKEGFLSANTVLKEKYKKQYFDNNLFKIGIIWKGRPTHGNDKNRSISLDLFLKLINRISSYKLYSLQKDLTQEEQELLRQSDIADIGSTFKDFADTAAAVDNLDLIISVDTAIVHLGGALGKETWVLLPKIGVDWRWGRAGDKSYWDDSVTLFRQEKPGNWETVFSSINSALSKKLNSKHIET